MLLPVQAAWLFAGLLTGRVYLQSDPHNAPCKGANKAVSWIHAVQSDGTPGPDL